MVGGISLIWAIPIEETTPMLKKAVAKYPFWKLDLSTAQFVRFRAADWDEFPSSRTGTGWAPNSHALLLFQLRFYDETPYLDLAGCGKTLRFTQDSKRLADKRRHIALSAPIALN